MKILEQFPPNIELIKLALPHCLDSKRTLFCYGDVIYNPFKIQVTADQEFHESIHTKQQGDNPEGWWNRYLTDPVFRLSQEIEAYGMQYKFLKDKKIPRKLFDWIVGKMSEGLASTAYGKLISVKQAESKIRNFGKSVV